MLSRERKRNLDVGKRIGRKVRKDDNQAAASLDEQMYRIRIRGDGDKHVTQAYQRLDDAKYKKSLDRIPFLPGQWTLQLHEKITKDLDDATALAHKALELYQSVHSNDKLESARKAADDVEHVRYHSLKMKSAEELLKESERNLQSGTRQGWPWGQEFFRQAEKLVEQAREEFTLAGETGNDDDTMRPKPKEFHLKKQQWRVHTARRECHLNRAPVQIELERLKKKEDTARENAILSLGKIGRIPVPRMVNFFGRLTPLEDESQWNAGKGRGDAEVVDAIIGSLNDHDWRVRKAVIAALPAAAAPGDERVVAMTLGLVDDAVPYVRSAAMESAVENSQRGAEAVISALVARLHDSDESVRRLAVRLLPDITDRPVDHFAIEQVLASLQKASESAAPTTPTRTTGAVPWVTRECDCLVASLQGLCGISPRGHDSVTRAALGMLRHSLDRVITDFTSPARDATNPLKGCADDVGESRGPVSLRAQFDALCRQPASSCAAKRCSASEQVRLEAIALLRQVAVRGVDIAEQRARIKTEEGRAGLSEEDKGKTLRDVQTLKARSYGDLLRHVLVVEGLCGSLLDFHRDVRWAAASAIAEIAERNDQTVVDGISGCLQSMDQGVRELAVGMLGGDTFGKVMDPGCSSMTDSLCSLLSDEVRETREAAAAALRAHCEPGDKGALFFLLQLLADERSFVREVALKLLVDLCPQGDKRVLRDLDACTRGVDPSVRIMAMYALVRISRHGDASTKQVIEKLLFDSDEGVRCAATYAMAQVCKRGDFLAVDRLLGSCDDMAESVRRASVDALTRLSDKDNFVVIETALKLVNDPSGVVRRQAYDTLSKLTDKGDDVVCSRIIARLGVEEDSVQAVEALATLRQLPWSPEKTVSFSRGTTAHSSTFWWSGSDGMSLSQRFRMQGGVPLTDVAFIRANTTGRLTTRTSVHDPKTPVLDVPFQIRPHTADADDVRSPSASIFRVDTARPARSLPGSVCPRTLSPKSKLASTIFAPYLVVDTDAGYDHVFALLLLFRAGLVPSLVTTIHGMAEAVAGAVVIKRVYTTIGHAAVPVVPGWASSTSRHSPVQSRVSSPGSSRGLASRGAGRAVLRPNGAVRRIPSRWGPDYRGQLAMLADHLSLAPLGITNAELLKAPGLHLRLQKVQHDLHRLATEADVNTAELDDEFGRVRNELDALTQGRDATFGEEFHDSIPETTLIPKFPGSHAVLDLADVLSDRSATRGDGLDVLRVESPVEVLSPASSETRDAHRRIYFEDEQRSPAHSSVAGADEEWLRTCFHPNAAVSALLSELMASNAASVSILCLGSLSNLDQALRRHAELVRERVKNVVVMGGAARVSPAAVGDHAYYKDGVEFNFSYDPKAAKRVLSSGLDVTMIGLEVANATVASPSLVDLLIHAQGSSLPAWILQQLVLMFDLAPAYASVAAFYMIRPEAFETEQVWVDIDVHTGRTREVEPGTESSVPVRMATAMDHESYTEFLRDVLND